ncbi:MAG: hypothetical protein JRF33_26110 [Deltaproteobacteria bacterium]|nr:hypothetical protein [Deltaproteobacteria bacterium]
MKRIAVIWMGIGLLGTRMFGCLDEEESSVLRYCVLVDMCGLELDRGLGFCVMMQSIFSPLMETDESTMARALMPMRTCFKGAGDCEQWRACYSPSEEQAAVCSAGEVLNFCDDSRFVNCNEDPPFVIDCAESGLECIELEFAGCGIAECDPLVTESACDGDMIVECASGILSSFSCPSYLGLTCLEVDGAPTCVGGSGEVCGAEHQDRCEGSTMVTCRFGWIGSVDCGSLHPQATCRMEEGMPACRPKSSGCDYTLPETCLDGVITYCDMGQIATLDCGQFGASGCEVTKLIAEDRDVARCVK